MIFLILCARHFSALFHYQSLCNPNCIGLNYFFKKVIPMWLLRLSKFSFDTINPFNQLQQSKFSDYHDKIQEVGWAWTKWLLDMAKENVLLPYCNEVVYVLEYPHVGDHGRWTSWGNMTRELVRGWWVQWVILVSSVIVKLPSY